MLLVGEVEAGGEPTAFVRIDPRGGTAEAVVEVGGGDELEAEPRCGPM
jgi:hypothetical protein